MTTIPTAHLNSQQYERLQAFYHLAVELSSLRSLESVLDTALKQCLELTDSQFGFIGLNASHGEAMDVVAIEGFHPYPQFYERFHLIPMRMNIFARVVLENQPVRSENAMTDPRRVGQPVGHPPVKTFLGVPLRLKDRPIGMIGVANRPQPYDNDHEQLLMTYAAQVAIVIHNVRLYEQLTAAKASLEQKVTTRTQQLQKAKEALADKAALLQRLLNETVDVQERERQRIAQDMHDSTSQLLVGAMLELKSAQERLGNGSLPQAETSLQSVREILHRVDAEIKRAIHDLRPPSLDELGLGPALRQYAVRFKQYSGLDCDVEILGTPRRLPSKSEISVYRLVQEALQNVSAHARADRANVIIVFSPRRLKVTIIDNGQGFDLDAVRCNTLDHFGLLSMQERTESLGGTLSIQTQPGQGTRVELTVPIPIDLPREANTNGSH
ncbi:MAG: GAF domain-containing sensor histidine kinase [Anaerolineae bacterium]|nr:GAF domain-containing sensor histidine kinase [Anaerolineae bacterium]